MFVFSLLTTLLFKPENKSMKRIFATITFVVAATVLFTSCLVSKKKYDAEKGRADREQNDIASLNSRLGTVTDLANRQAKEIHQLKVDKDNLNGQLGTLNDQNDRLTNWISKLKDSIRDKEEDISDLQGKVSNISDENKKRSKQLNDEIAAQKKRLEQLQSFIDQQQRATEALRKKIADALEGFNSNELTITRKNGKVYISMQEGLLFPSGSAEVNPKGKDALKKVAGVLNTNADINIDIEGHTDSLPIHTAKYADNWALSTARATSIAHVLIDEYKVTPAKLVASGRSQYDPVATNSTSAGRAANRRTEIILEPKLDEIMQLLNGGAEGKK
jgi:chemotaxis protein MotB